MLMVALSPREHFSAQGLFHQHILCMSESLILDKSTVVNGIDPPDSTHVLICKTINR